MTTVFLRDMSDFDSDENVSGFVGVTHKATEGTTVTHQQYGPRLNRFHAQAVPVLGAYHVLRTPGSGGNGSLSSQLDFWLSRLDSQTPWWRDHPNWVMQVDAEKWPYDAVTLDRPVLHEEARRLLEPSHFADLVAARASTTVAFCALLNANVPHGFKIAYASRGQYGNNLTGIPVDLWNAAYHSSSYPGDAAADWAPYSGRAPVFWQFTSTPFDKSAYRGSLAELLTLTGGTDMALDPNDARALGNCERYLQAAVLGGATVHVETSPGHFGDFPNSLQAKLDEAAAGTPVTLSPEDRAAIVAALPTAADVAANLDYGKLAAALAPHFHVS